MGRLIDADKLAFREIDEIGGEYEPFYGCSKKQIDNAPTVEAIPKADYENRLKADMVAMLEELSMKIGEIEDGYTEFDEENKRSLTMIPLESVERLIDREINSLKEKEHDAIKM